MDINNTLLILILYKLQQFQTRLDRIESSMIDLLEQDDHWLFSQCHEVEKEIENQMQDSS
tara:strand:+ start:532 stop:711 length:180 start_codon:yes stop_codon:yes gene_type:complete